ncbi:uncharacterized protein LOC128223092 [Mya arenaria]|uniref:uncharacterized protein LOC128223072 n=1 Tax=Mya arenaria TaxID=6604 RepID=UPI0022DF4E4E|nr:uncharacterized protein LOC128223072 [Mya arenaria]XP_052788297.1 uncharacterized protein LOC128223092 [Mya arenaria]
MNGCSYACLNVSGPVCPLPEWLNGPRTPGSINTLSCNAWQTGGGTATCGNDLKWSAVVKKCRSILNLKCQNDTVCAPINAQCRSGRCECGPGMSYNFIDNMCVSASSPVDFCKEKNDGLYKDPKDCAYYYQCSSKHGHRMPCPSETYFNETLQICDSAANVLNCP